MAYIPALDGIRAIAVMLVMAFHANTPWVSGGFLGVDVFFVLSGFLITSILYAEIARTGRIDIRRFYVRRFARLAPPLGACLVLYLVAAPYAWPEYYHHMRDALLAAAYLSDYSTALWGMPEMLRHTWSLAAEEHFYLLWPLVLLLLRPLQPRTVLLVLLALYATGTAWRIACLELHGWYLTYYRFDTRATGMIAGAALALAVRCGYAAHLGRAAPILCVTLGYLIAFSLYWRNPMALQAGVITAELTTAATIVLIVQSGAPRWLGSPGLSYIGRLSYGLYLFHYPVMHYLRDEYDWPAALVVGSAAALALSAISYHTIEAWVRRCRGSAAHDQTGSAAPTV
ncbi:acyltransferase [Pseudomonas sp. MAP12]|uniref:Acyltransferase n=1 Tax=Geopseudomonas aromaticivorans TaxID=2849492 RepID=A0ABS6MTD1_9GAMM|nr:acyltransferase [Pseudomonas aromaticivorans]MBV2132059.1 acyltransferase [Pseudomonas aromaticivorans]